MRHVRSYKELFENQTELSQEQIEWLDEFAMGRWTLNPQTGLVDVRGSFDCSLQDLADFKGVRFGEVTVSFDCSHTSLTSLEGAPQKVGGAFYCNHNQLTSLEGAPQKVWASFNCEHNGLVSLEGAPLSVGRYFYCSGNPVSESVLKALYKKMQSGMSWPDAVASYWRYIRSNEDKILLAPSNPVLSPEDVKGYEALGRVSKRII
jgi:hypothetical protein